MSTVLTVRAARALLALVLLCAAVATVVRLLPDGEHYHVEMAHSGGIREGDKVRIAGLEVGEVLDVGAERDTVHVEFTLDEGTRITDDTVVEVKLESLLGQRFLALSPGRGGRLDPGATLPRTQVRDPYTIEEFWLEGAETLSELDLGALDRAIDVLTEDLSAAPADVHAALRGLGDLAGLVNARDEQVARLIEVTRSVTTTVLDQQDEIEQLMDDGELVMAMVQERKEALRLLLRDSRRLAGRLTDLARRATPEVEPALRDLRRVLRVLEEHAADLDLLLERLGPTMRVYTNAAGDGPWLGVNAPYFVLGDDFWCTLMPKGCAR